MEHLIGGAGELGWVAAKAVLLYLTAVFGLRLGESRTLADLSPFAAFAWEERGGYGDAYQTAQAFSAAARRLGVRLRQGITVTGIVANGARAVGVKAHGDVWPQVVEGARSGCGSTGGRGRRRCRFLVCRNGYYGSESAGHAKEEA